MKTASQNYNSISFYLFVIFNYPVSVGFVLVVYKMKWNYYHQLLLQLRHVRISYSSLTTECVKVMKSNFHRWGNGLRKQGCFDGLPKEGKIDLHLVHFTGLRDKKANMRPYQSVPQTERHSCALMNNYFNSTDSFIAQMLLKWSRSI